MRLVVSNLPEAIKQEDVIELFSRFGRVGQVRLLYNIYTGKFRQMAYVDMTDKGCAASAVRKLNQTRIHGSLITVALAVSGKL